MNFLTNLFGKKKDKPNNQITIQTLKWKEFYESFNNSQNSILLDVRTLEEYNQLRIPGSVLVDIHSPNFKELINRFDKEKEYYVYCRRGIRSMNAANIMIECGFTKIVNLSGGISGWEGPTESEI